MLVNPDQLLCHLFGDYVLQSDWMALTKTSKSRAAALHAAVYGLPFLLLGPSAAAWAFVVVSHFVIDRWRLARHVGWLKNFLAPRWIEVRVGASPPPPAYGFLARRKPDRVEPDRERIYLLRNHPWAECSGTGYAKDKPAWMAVWLMIIVDQAMHLLLNALALKYL